MIVPPSIFNVNYVSAPSRRRSKRRSKDKYIIKVLRKGLILETASSVTLGDAILLAKMYKLDYPKPHKIIIEYTIKGKFIKRVIQ